MSQLKFVYFDVGGVLLRDYSASNKWEEMRRGLGITPDQDLIFNQIWQKYHARMCLDCDIDSVFPEIKKAIGLSTPDNYSLLDDFVHRFEQNPSIWPVAELAKQKFKVGLLTNMYPRMFSKIVQQGLLPEIAWDVVIDSSAVGMQKPNPEIFALAEAKACMLPGEILFVENSEANLKPAQVRGWQTLLYDFGQPEKSSQKVRELLV